MKDKTLRLILGDQLNYQHSWYENKSDNVWYVLMEIRQETDYVHHHIQKVIGFFASMRNFAAYLEKEGHQVIYYQLDDKENKHSLAENIQHIIKAYEIERFEYQYPDEYRLDQHLEQICQEIDQPSEGYSTEHFLSERLALAEFFEGKKQYLLESFYRHMRKQYDILMEGEDPLTGQWNYDADNRKKLPKKHEPVKPFIFDKDVSAIYKMIIDEGIETIGEVEAKHFIWPTSREEALELLDFFLEKCLPLFGTYQDAMTPDYWALYHSRLSFCINTKMLSPLEVVQKAEQYWKAHQEEIDISQIEGFIRQILGWREYMRGVYWAHMPEYAEKNYFDHQRKLPEFFWTGKTKMACLSHAIEQSLHYAYAHHIQRLMLTGNFALLAGIHPDKVDEWYLGIYIDAIEWVEITNTRGMSQFADGGIVGTKPYVSSANYIDKMSHYCKTCHYDKKKKVGDQACPFNSLYWHFYNRHESLLSNNPRVAMMYRTWERMGSEKQAEIIDQAEKYLEKLDTL